MKKTGMYLLILFLLCGCISQGSCIDVSNGIHQMALKTVDHMIYLQAKEAMEARCLDDYSVLVESVSGSVMTFLKEKDHDVHQLMIHGAGYTQWIQLFDDRILCLTGNDGHVTAELKNDLFEQSDLKVMIDCALHPVELVENRSFQRVSGAEEGSLQIATDNIDYWMKVSSEGVMDQVRLYFSDLPMMTLTYSNEMPAFPAVTKQDYPTYKEFLYINDEVLRDSGFDDGKRVLNDSEEIITYDPDEFFLDYQFTDDETSMQLIFNEFVLRGFYTDHKAGTFCEVVLIGDEPQDDEIACNAKETAMLQKLFEKIKDEFK